jgi:hypothetical protein
VDERLSEEAVENLVTQFSSALDFYRELVQNSIDAGSSSVVVWTEFEPGEGIDGVISLHVDDFGEGMNEEIIDDQLTQLFSSSKENDLTKIGKFGIGFVSVFALRPKGVLVHTGRDGEYWEVFFHEDRSFTKARLETPIEGTQITLFLTGDRTRYCELVEGSLAALRKWCSHSDTEISFEDRSPDGDSRGEIPINEPFAVVGECGVTVEHPDTELALAFNETPMYGFYNKGLALAVTHAGEDVLEGRAHRYRHIAFKIKSRYIEHTLSRETVMRDENYDKAMTLLDEAAERELRRELVKQLEALCALPEWELPHTARYARLMRFLAAEPDAAFVPLRGAKILRGIDGGAHPLQAVESAVERDGWVFVAPSSSRLTALLAAQGIVVFRGTSGDGREAEADAVGDVIARYLATQARLDVLGFVRARLGFDHRAEAMAKLAHPEHVMVGVSVENNPAPPERDLLLAVHELLEATSHGYRDLSLGVIEGSPPRLFVLGRELAPVMPLPPRGVYARGLLERPRVVVNRRHPHFRRLLALARTQPELATYCLAKAIMLEEDHALHDDSELIAHATRAIRPQLS